MSSRKEKLHLLRQHVCQMQNQLRNIENVEKEGSRKWNTIAQLREVSINRENKDYRRNGSKDSRNNSREPRSVSGKKSAREYPSTSRVHHRDQAQNLLSQTLKDIINKIDNNYYKEKEPTPTKPASIKASFNNTSYIGQRYLYTNAPNSPMATSKQSKLRTFKQKKTDTILNPEQSPVRGIKIVKKIQPSPDRMLTENPKSDPNLYLFTTQPVYIHKKSHLKNKNESSIALSPSTKFMIPLRTANSQEKSLLSQKKHFQRHIQENICSRYLTLQ